MNKINSTYYYEPGGDPSRCIASICALGVVGTSKNVSRSTNAEFDLEIGNMGSSELDEFEAYSRRIFTSLACMPSGDGGKFLGFDVRMGGA